MPDTIEMLDIELVGGCNYRCRMCPHSDPGRESDFIKALPWETFTSIIDQCLAMGLRSVRLHGSGEPTLCRYLPEAVAYCCERGLRTLITTNGARLTESLSQDLMRAGLNQLTVSATGYDRATYQTWMGTDGFESVRENVRYYRDLGSAVNTYHLIIDPRDQQREVELYRANWQDYTGAGIEIWQMHNWSGNYQQVRFQRQRGAQRSCGRMFRPVLEVRAGGLDGHHGAVVACCMVLGNDSAAVLGHADTDAIQDIWNNQRYQQLRSAHQEGRWNDISYCQGCDQLYENSEVLVYTDLEDRVVGRPKLL